MNMIPSILQPLGAIVLEQQEVTIQSDLSIQGAEDDPDDNAFVVAAVAAIIDDGAAGVVDDVLGQETEDTAPPIRATPPSNSGCSRKRGVATTAHATTSSSKKKKVAAQCCKGARVKVTRSNLFHVLEHDEQRETLKGYVKIAGTTTDKFYLGVGSKAAIFASTAYLLAFKMSPSNARS
jgi:hypothetical protein